MYVEEAHLAATHTSWNVYPQLSAEQFRAALATGVPPVLAQLLYNRGVTEPEQMKTFVFADYKKTLDPYGLIDMRKAVERIRKALDEQEHITVYGDFDADGVTSSALLFRALRTLKQPGANLDYHIPHRLNDGCGLNLSALDMLHQRGTRLIITTDCASSDVEQVEYARTLGIDVIITDHHTPPAQLPPAYAMVNPWRADANSEDFRVLCGVGIAFKLTQALYRLYQRTEEEEMELLDLVAIGTIADIAPLLGENHTLAFRGLERLNLTSKPGLLALIASANLTPGRIRERDIAYALSPRINAAGRMQEASIAFDLLTTDSQQEAARYAQMLQQLNLSRQQETEALMQNVRAQAQGQEGQRVVLVAGDDWHEGILGLVAGKLSEEIDKPVLVLNNDSKTKLSRGSARSRKGYNIIAALRDFAHKLERYGGHNQAAGFTIQSTLIEELRTHLQQWREGAGLNGSTAEMLSELEESTAPAEPPAALELLSPLAPQWIDLTLSRWEMLTYDFYQKMRLLAPFGAANPEPIFRAEGVQLLNARVTGRELQNIQFWLGAPHPLYGTMLRHQGTLFKGASRIKEFAGVSHVTVVFRLESSEDAMRRDIWLRILDITPIDKRK
jgi:single-stranded-DNA-specific exonuclease